MALERRAVPEPAIAISGADAASRNAISTRLPACWTKDSAHGGLFSKLSSMPSPSQAGAAQRKRRPGGSTVSRARNSSATRWAVTRRGVSQERSPEARLISVMYWPRAISTSSHTASTITLADLIASLMGAALARLPGSPVSAAVSDGSRAASTTCSPPVVR